uniref:hydroxyisourate hydrolase n=1 Tax=Anopheles epiroticus TaxID=199890 RepID=A0A182P184_9DIPT
MRSASSCCARHQHRHLARVALSVALTALLIATTAAAAAASISSSSGSTDDAAPEDATVMQNLSTHILDTTRGKPAPEVPVTLYVRTTSQTWTKVSTGITDGDGRFKSFFAEGQPGLQLGVYKLHFDVAQYFRARSVESLYPFIEIVFSVADPSQHYHIPLLLNPFGYSTYRGS